MSKEQRQGQEAALAASAMARAALRTNRAVSQPSQKERERKLFEAFQRRVAEDTPPPVLPEMFETVNQLGFIWLEFLGPAFGMPQEGHAVPVYGRVKDFVLCILDEGNAQLVVKTLEDAHRLLLLTGCPEDSTGTGTRLRPSLVDGMTAHFHSQQQQGRLTVHEVRYRVKFWQQLEGGLGQSTSKACQLQNLVVMIKAWQTAWMGYGDPAAWGAGKHRRRLLCTHLLDAAEVLRGRADAFNWSPLNEEEWLEWEAERLLGSAPLRQPDGSFRKRKRREGSEEERNYKALLAEVNALKGDKERLEGEKYRLQEENTALAAAAEEDKAALRQHQLRFETEVACQICLSSPRNAVLLPCRHGQFCGPCIKEHQKSRDTCPTCRAKIKTVIVCVGS